MKGRDYLKDRGVDRRIILKWIFKKQCEGVNWIREARRQAGSGLL
jgi:hypothetical protein